MNYIELYHSKIQSGEILVSNKIRTQMDKLMYLLKYPTENYIDHIGIDGEIYHREYFVFDQHYAELPILFIEQFCYHLDGKFAGKKIKLELWQKAIISALYGFISKDNSYRKHRRLHLYIARKNGKTILSACLILYELLAGGEKGAQCYSAATKRDQAKIPWNMAKRMIERSPVLRKRLDTLVTGIYSKPLRDNNYETVSKESQKLDGLSAHVSHIDELHAIKDDNLIDVLWDSTKIRTQPIELITTTMGMERSATFDKVYEADERVLNGITIDPRLLVFCYELDEESEWSDIRYAVKANPNLGVSLSVNDLHAEIEKAKNDPTKLINLLCKSFNVRQNSRHAWLSFETLNNEEIYTEEQLRKFDNTVVIGGFDLSRVNDLTAFSTMLFDRERQKIIIKTQYWATKKYIESDVNQKVPLKSWVRQGYIRESGIDLINYHDITEYIQSEFEKYGYMYQYINYDAYSAGYLIEELESIGYSRQHVLIKTHQGFQTLSVPMQEMEANLKSKMIIYQNNPVTKWCLSNVELMMDRNGNYMPKKGSYERKIDGVATILNCYVSLCKNKEFFLGEGV